MTTLLDSLALAFDAFADAYRSPFRSEPRRDEVQIVEYTPFPRTSAQGPRIGFTRDLSGSGMCIGCDRPEPVGALLRVMLRADDGHSGRPCIDRVVWCQPAGDGRFWIGLERVTSP
jgi:hypothetical protein